MSRAWRRLFGSATESKIVIVLAKIKGGLIFVFIVVVIIYMQIVLVFFYAHKQPPKQASGETALLAQPGPTQ